MATPCRHLERWPAHVRPEIEASSRKPRITRRFLSRAPLFARLLGILVPALLTLSVNGQAQVPFDACLDRDNRPIPGVVDNSITYAAVATEQNGRPVILWNARENGRLSRTEQLFIYLHECAHHTLGHLYLGNDDARHELEADCWAIQLMVDGGMIKERHFEVLERSRRTVRGDYTHLGGDAHVRSLEECLSVRTNAKAWAATLDTLVVAAQDSFATRRGRLVDSSSTPPVFEALLDVPGTYDCEIVGGAFRCMVFAARKDGAAEKRYQQLVKILHAWLPVGWTSTEQLGANGKDRTFLAQDSRTGTLITWACAGARVYLLVKRAPV
jgi:hypothetical protein